MTLNADHPTPENAVRQYLDFLGDPATLVDHDRVAALQDALNGPDAPTDPIERLRVDSELDRARTVDSELVTAGFISAAKAFADAEGITADAFRRQGVPSDVLVRAGFGGTAKATGTRSQRVNAATVSTHVLGRSGTWTYNDIESGTGASIGTVRKVVDDLVSAKRVKSLGADPDHASRGRAPNLFTVA
jgi:hypothetical protein